MRLVEVEVFIVLLLSFGVTSRKERAVTELVRRLHGSHAGASSGGANGAGRSRTRGVGCQASRDSDHNKKGAMKTGKVRSRCATAGQRNRPRDRSVMSVSLAALGFSHPGAHPGTLARRRTTGGGDSGNAVRLWTLLTRRSPLRARESCQFHERLRPQR